MDLSKVIHSVKWSFLGRSYESCVEDADFEDNELTLILPADTKLFDYFIVVDGEEIEIGEIDLEIIYKAKFRFDSIDIIRDECSYTHSVELQDVCIYDISDHENLLPQVRDKIESDISERRNFVLDDSTFEVVMW